MLPPAMAYTIARLQNTEDVRRAADRRGARRGAGRWGRRAPRQR